MRNGERRVHNECHLVYNLHDNILSATQNWVKIEHPIAEQQQQHQHESRVNFYRSQIAARTNTHTHARDGGTHLVYAHTIGGVMVFISLQQIGCDRCSF